VTNDYTPYDFKKMSLSALRAALDAPTGDYFARAIANELFSRITKAEEATA